MSKSNENATTMTPARAHAVESYGEANVAALENCFDDMVRLYLDGYKHFANTNEAAPLGSLRRWPQYPDSIQIPSQHLMQKQLREECNDFKSRILDDWYPGIPFSQELTPEEIKTTIDNFGKMNRCGYVIIHFNNRVQKMEGSTLPMNNIVFSVRFLGDKKDYSFYLRDKDRPDVTILAFENTETPPRAFMIQNREDGRGMILEVAKFSTITSTYDNESERSVFSVFNRGSQLFLDTPLLSHGLFDCYDEITKASDEDTAEEETD